MVALLLVVITVCVPMVALLRARQEDVPRVFEAFAGAFGFRSVLGTLHSSQAVDNAKSMDELETEK